MKTKIKRSKGWTVVVIMGLVGILSAINGVPNGFKGFLVNLTYVLFFAGVFVLGSWVLDRMSGKGYEIEDFS